MRREGLGVFCILLETVHINTTSAFISLSLSLKLHEYHTARYCTYMNRREATTLTPARSTGGAKAPYNPSISCQSFNCIPPSHHITNPLGANANANVKSHSIPFCAENYQTHPASTDALQSYSSSDPACASHRLAMQFFPSLMLRFPGLE